jgi:hypothetical protein
MLLLLALAKFRDTSLPRWPGWSSKETRKSGNCRRPSEGAETLKAPAVRQKAEESGRIRKSMGALAVALCTLALPAHAGSRHRHRPPVEAAVVRRVRTVWKALGHGNAGPLREWAGPRLHVLEVGSRTHGDDVPTNREALRPLLRWAERHRHDKVRRVVVHSNIRPDGYTTVSLRLTRGAFDVGITRDGRLHKVFAARRPISWD